MVFGAAAELLRHHLEVRGLGILNIKDLFGVTAIRERKRIDVVVRLVEWSKETEYDRMGLDDNYHTILGVQIRELLIPVRPGRDMASILEVAARNELLKNAGHHAAREFFGNLEGVLMGERPADESAVLPPLRVGGPPSSGVPVRHRSSAPTSPTGFVEVSQRSAPKAPESSVGEVPPPPSRPLPAVKVTKPRSSQ
jgi:HPr kinase/phosphorylase